MVWIHGWLGDGAEGEQLVPLLGEDVLLLCPDLPGHGETPLAEWTLSQVLKVIAEICREADAAIGYSLGGRLLMMSAAQYPLCFGPLVIESSHPGLTTARERSERRNTDDLRAEELRRDGLQRFCESWYAAEMWGGLTPPQRQGDAEELAGALERFSLCHQPDLRPWLRSCGHEILWLAGRRDPAYVEHTRWIQQNTSHTGLILDAGHNVHAQCPAAWAEHLRARLTTPETTEERA